MEIWLYPSGDDSNVIDGIDRIIGKDVKIVDEKLYQNETLIGASIVISNDEDQNRAISLAGSASWVLLEFENWAMIPIENIISAFTNSGTKIAAMIRTVPEAQGAGFALELGVDALVTSADKELIEACKVVKSIRLEKTLKEDQQNVIDYSKIPTSLSNVISADPIGTGDRACIDLTCLLEPGEGMFVGASSQSMCLVHGETISSEYVPTRPFRVNAGSVNMYVLMANGETKYISEIKSGDEVLVAKENGVTRTAFVGRMKIEHRPLILLKWQNRNGNNHHATIQQAETVRIVSEFGDCISVTDIEKNTQIVTFEYNKTRHIGKVVSSSVTEI